MEYKIKSFTIYAEYYELIDNLPVGEKKELLLAINDYMFKGIEPKLKGMSLAIFNNLRRPLDKSKKQSQKGTKYKPSENQTSNRNTNQTSNQISNQTTNTSLDVDVNVYVNVNVFNYFSNNMHSITSIECQKIEEWLKVFPEEVICYAIDQCVLYNVRTMKYLDAILTNWKNKGYKSLEDAKNDKPKLKGKEAIIPEWLNKEDYKETTSEEIEELNKLLEEFKE